MRESSPRLPVWVLVVACRAATSLRAVMACVVNTAAVISAADTKVTLVICFPYGDRSQGSARLLIVKSGQPWELFHHALSRQRELLRTLRGATITPRAAASTLSNSAEKRRWHHRYPQPSPRYSGRCMPHSRQMAKLPNVCVIGKYPDPNLGLPFRNAHASVRITTINRYGPVRQAAWDASAAGLD
jgi:hypothetical protein